MYIAAMIRPLPLLSGSECEYEYPLLTPIIVLLMTELFPSFVDRKSALIVI